MMRWIVKTSIRFRFLVVALGGAMMVFGMAQLRNMPVDVFPEFAPPPVPDEVALAGQEPSEAPARPDDRQPVGAPAFSWPVPPIAPSTEG